MLPILISSLALVPVAGFAVWWLLFQTYHLAVVDPGKLYRAGNRGMREFANTLRRVRPRTIVSLIEDAELNDPAKPEFQAESKLLDKTPGVQLLRIPIPLGGWPTDDDIRAFLAIAEDSSEHPVIVHCAQGVRRTGMMVAAYQLSVLGLEKSRVKEKMLTFGHSQRTVGDVQRFIDVYDPTTRQMTAVLQKSVE